MTTLLRFLFVVPFGFVAACFAASFALLSPFLDTDGARTGDPVFWIGAGFLFLAQAAQVGSAALVPWAVFMAATEILALNSLLLHIAAGGLAGFAYAELAYGATPPPASIMTALVVAGLGFAMVYWIVAGRAAGRWRQRYRGGSPA